MKNQSTLEKPRAAYLSQEPDEDEAMNDDRAVKALVILSPTASGQAIDRVMEIADSGHRSVKLYLKYVVDMDPVAEVFLDERHLERMKKEGRDTVGRQVERLRGRGVDTEVLPPHFGIAAEEILRVEKQIHPDVIVVGAPRTSTVKRLLWGDFCEEVVRQASTPVLTVRLNGERPTYHRQVAVGQYARTSTT